MRLTTGLVFLMLGLVIYHASEVAASDSSASPTADIAEVIAKLTKDFGEVVVQAKKIAEKVTKGIITKTSDEVASVIKQLHAVFDAVEKFNDQFEKFFEGLNSKVEKIFEDLA
ncbi:unnamed protein product, partial [Iphiclides podalirius]